MIHTLTVDEEFELGALRKEFRKKLMTGGAVVRIPAHLAEDNIENIFARLDQALDGTVPTRHSIAEEILRELIRHEASSESLLQRIGRYSSLPSIHRELARRARSVTSG